MMNIKDLLKDIWQMIKDYKWILLITTVLSSVILTVATVFIQRATYNRADTDITDEQEVKIGTIDIFADSSFDNISFYPSLPSDLIEEIHSWEKFSGDFSFSLNADSTLNFSNYSMYDEESYNPLESFLNLTNTQRENILYDETTGNYYMTVEVNPNNGNMRIAGSHFGVSDYLIDLNITDQTSEEELLSTIYDEGSILDISFGMDPGGERLARIETLYDWNYGVNYPSLFSNERNFYIFDPQPFNTVSTVVETNGLSLRNLLLQLGWFTVISFFIILFAVFIWNLISKTINYSFTYGWSNSDLHLKYSEKDTEEQIAFDMLQSTFSKLAIISEEELPNTLIEKVKDINIKDIHLRKNINQLPLNTEIEEFILVIKRYSTKKEWYIKQRKHLKAYRNKSIKIIEI